MASLVWVAIIFALMILNVPVSVAMFISGIVTIIGLIGTDPIITIGLTFNALSSSSLMAAPIFMLLGKVMLKGHTSKALFDFANVLVGWMRGGAGAVNVVSSMIFGGMSGSAVADVASLGPMEMEMMEKRGYSTTYAAGITAATSVCSPIIPPSVIMIVYALTAQVSSLRMLLSGIVPGLIICAVFLVINYFISKRHNWQPPEKVKTKEILKQLKVSFPALLTPILLIGGMLSGKFTPSEVGFVCLAYVLFLELVIYRKWKRPLKIIKNAISESLTQSGNIMLIICNATLAAYILAYNNIPTLLSDFILSITSNTFVILAIISAIIIILGCFMEIIAIITIAVPVFMVLANNIGVDMISFGLIVILSCSTGYITPPLGTSMYALSTVRPDLTIGKIARGAFPFLIGMVGVIMIYLLFPDFGLVFLKLMPS